MQTKKAARRTKRVQDLGNKIQLVDLDHNYKPILCYVKQKLVKGKRTTTMAINVFLKEPIS